MDVCYRVDEEWDGRRTAAELLKGDALEVLGSKVGAKTGLIVVSLTFPFPARRCVLFFGCDQ